MEPQSPLAGTDGRAELHPIATVHPHAAAVVNPRDPEDDLPLRLRQPLKDPRPLKPRIGIHYRLQRGKNLENRLQEFLFTGIPSFDLPVYPVNILVLKHTYFPFFMGEAPSVAPPAGGPGL